MARTTSTARKSTCGFAIRHIKALAPKTSKTTKVVKRPSSDAKEKPPTNAIRKPRRNPPRAVAPRKTRQSTKEAVGTEEEMKEPDVEKD